MRLTPESPDAPCYLIFFCGQRLTDCLLADDGAGEVEVFIRDAEGRFVLYPDRSPATARLRGPVEIRPADPLCSAVRILHPRKTMRP